MSNGSTIVNTNLYFPNTKNSLELRTEAYISILFGADVKLNQARSKLAKSFFKL